MSSLDQNGVRADGPAPRQGTGSTAAIASGTTRRPAGAAQDTAAGTVPSQRQGKAQRSGANSTPDRAVRPAAARAPRTSRTVAVKAATGAKAAARATAAGRKTTTATPAAAKPAVAGPAAAPAPARRPTPYKRSAVAETPVVEQAPVAAVVSPADQPVAPADPTVAPAPAASPQVDAAEVVTAVAAGRRHGRHRTPASRRRRSALYLAAALIGAVSIGAVSLGNPAAQADTASRSVSVAHQLGIDAGTQAVTPADATRLRELAASRNERGAEQAAAVEAQATADRNAVEAARPRAVLPVGGARLTSTFGMRWGTLHAGIDLAAPIGTPEYAAADGVVLKAGPASGFGLAVYIQHSNGDVSVYGHMEKILVTDGQVVRAGDTIALLGAQGQATGPHLHFEVHVGGMAGPRIDPLPWLRERGVSI
jgi:murein DD-endopeptidase MepM/ murein hydrolase activator NlpD